ncbi:alpha/beta fold hydrolase [Roseobacter sp.]|uniref:alpha/beta fold hydrolase n=1 Tax=Roseobacter sp. TaxID=1907202 RepID=UPI00385A43BF
MRRDGALPPRVCLRGLGSVKENYADIALRPDFADLTLVIRDATGFGGSEVRDPTFLSIPFLKQVALAACEALAIARFLLFGRSMGDSAGLMLAHAHSDRVFSFANIGCNVAPQGCFLFRQIIQHPAVTPEVWGGLSTE